MCQNDAGFTSTRISKTYRLRPSWKIPLRTDEAVRVQDAVHHRPFDDVCANDGRIHWVGVLPPCGLGDGLPRMAVNM